MSNVKEKASICPLIHKDNDDGHVECVRDNCAWWNERFERCSVFVIGDRIDDIAVALEKEVGT